MLKTSQSLLDLLIRLMPDLANARGAKTDPKLANLLYNRIWADETNKVGSNSFRCPQGVRPADLDRLSSAGLITRDGDTLEITKKGGEVLKQMILGDSRSIFEYDGNPVDYMTALASLKPSGRRKYGKTASSEQPFTGFNWYSRLKQ